MRVPAALTHDIRVCMEAEPAAGHRIPAPILSNSAEGLAETVLNNACGQLLSSAGRLSVTFVFPRVTAFLCVTPARGSCPLERLAWPSLEDTSGPVLKAWVT